MICAVVRAAGPRAFSSKSKARKEFPELFPKVDRLEEIEEFVCTDEGVVENALVSICPKDFFRPKFAKKALVLNSAYEWRLEKKYDPSRNRTISVAVPYKVAPRRKRYTKRDSKA